MTNRTTVHTEAARRALTKKTRPSGNSGLDNEEQNLIVSVRDVLGGREVIPTQPEYVVLDLLGQGTFGQVFRCQNVETKEVVAIKVIRNHPSYYKQAIVEVQITRLLNASYHDEEAPHLVRLLDTFEFRNHLCLIFELLSINLYELISENNFNGFPLSITRGFLQQILHGLVQLEEIGVIHCDLKPENILLFGQDKFLSDVAYYGDHHAGTSGAATQTPYIKIVDFGSACHENQTVYSYIQSRFYRSPEVLLGIPYTGAIDLWSLGCIAVEMFLGLPVFPGVSEHDQLRLIEETLGKLPQELLRQGRNVLKFFKVKDGHHLMLKTPNEFARDTNGEAKVSKKYFKYSKLEDMIHAYPYAKHTSPAQLRHERAERDAFLHFVRGLLCVDPLARWNAKEAIRHPFITGAQFVREEVEFTQSIGRSTRASPSADDRTRSVAPLSSPPSDSKVRPQQPKHGPTVPRNSWTSPSYGSSDGGRTPTYALAYTESIWGPLGMPPLAAGPMPYPDSTRPLQHSARAKVSSIVTPAVHDHSVYVPMQFVNPIQRIPVYHKPTLFSPPYRPIAPSNSLTTPPHSISSSSDSYPVLPMAPYEAYELGPRYYLHTLAPAPPKSDEALQYQKPSRHEPTTTSWGQEPIPRHHQYASTATSSSQPSRRAKRQHTASWDSGDTRDLRRHEPFHLPRESGRGQYSQHRYATSVSSAGSTGSARTDPTPRRSDSKAKPSKHRKSPRRTGGSRPHSHRHPENDRRIQHRSMASGRDDAAPTCSVEKFSSAMSLDVSSAAVPLPTT